jgi:hypothetical protein
MQNKYEPQDLNKEIATHLIKELMRFITINGSCMALITRDALHNILEEFAKVMENFQPSKTQIEILENISKKESCLLIKSLQNPLTMSVESLKALTANEVAYCRFENEFYFIGNDYKAHSLNLKDSHGTNGYSRFHSLFNNYGFMPNSQKATTEDLEFILSYTGHVPHNKNKFAYNVAGNFALEAGNESFNLHTGEGLKATGLCKLFFDVLHVNPLLYFVSPTTSFSGREEVDLSYWLNLFPATTSTLKPSPAYRAKQMLLHLCQEIAKQATPLQLKALVTELQEESKDTISKLCEPRGIMGFFYSSTNTNAYSNYETHLLKLFNQNTVMPSFIQKLLSSSTDRDKYPMLVKDIYKLLASTLDEKDYSSLSCVNIELSKEKNNVLEESRLQLGKKF